MIFRFDPQCRTIAEPSFHTPRGNHTSAIGASKYYWPKGQVITVNFFDSNRRLAFFKSKVTPFVRAQVEKYAHVWEHYANIKFQFVDDKDDAMIRIKVSSDKKGIGGQTIGYGDGGGLGKNLLTVPEREFNMELYGFDATTSEEEFSEIVIHEFGHALGLVHEHRHWGANIDQDIYFKYLMRTYGWSLKQAKDQASIYDDAARAMYGLETTAYDKYSIMHYDVPKECTKNKLPIRSSNKLSQRDKAFIATVYPFPASPPGEVDKPVPRTDPIPVSPVSDLPTPPDDKPVNPVIPVEVPLIPSAPSAPYLPTLPPPRTPLPPAGSLVYSIRNKAGFGFLDIFRDDRTGEITLLNNSIGLYSSMGNEEYIFWIKSANGNWYSPVFTFSSNKHFGAIIQTGIVSFGPSKGQSLMIQVKEPGQSTGRLIFKE